MTLQTIGMILCIGSAGILFVGRTWRWVVAALSVVYLGGFMLIYTRWPLEQTAIFLVGGWMAVAVLGATGHREVGEIRIQDAGAVFRLLIFVLLLIVSWSVSQDSGELIPDISFEGGFVGILLIAAGMVRSGFVQDALQVILSLLLVFAGFELIYSFVSTSALMTALLAAVNLGLALLGSYLALRYAQTEEEVEL